MASLDSQGEIVPVELANPEETQIGKGENEPVCSFILPPSFDKHSGWYGNGLIEVNERFPLPDLSRKIEGDSIRRVSRAETYDGSPFAVFLRLH